MSKSTEFCFFCARDTLGLSRYFPINNNNPIRPFHIFTILWPHTWAWWPQPPPLCQKNLSVMTSQKDVRERVGSRSKLIQQHTNSDYDVPTTLCNDNDGRNFIVNYCSNFILIKRFKWGAIHVKFYAFHVSWKPMMGFELIHKRKLQYLVAQKLSSISLCVYEFEPHHGFSTHIMCVKFHMYRTWLKTWYFIVSHS